MLSPKPGFSLNPEPWTFLTPSKSWTPQAMAVQTRRGRDFLRDAQQRHRGRALTSFMKYLACTRIFPFVICASIYNIYAAYTFFSIYIYTQAWQMCIWLCHGPTLCLCLRLSLCKPPFIRCFYYLLPYYVVLWCYVLLCYAIYGFVMLCC